MFRYFFNIADPRLPGDWARRALAFTAALCFLALSVTSEMFISANDHTHEYDKDCADTHVSNNGHDHDDTRSDDDKADSCAVCLQIIHVKSFLAQLNIAVVGARVDFGSFSANPVISKSSFASTNTLSPVALNVRLNN